MADKTLKISTKLDNEGLKNLNRELQKLQLSAKNIEKSMAQWHGKATVGQAKFAKGLIETNKELTKMQKMSKETARVIKDDYSKALEGAKLQLKTLDQQLIRYNRSYNKFGEMAGRASGAHQERLLNAQARVRGRIVGMEASRQNLAQDIKELEEPATNLTKKILKGIGIASIAAAVTGGLEAAQLFKTSGLTNTGAALSPFNSQFQGVLGGNLTQAGLANSAMGLNVGSRALGQGIPKAIEWSKILGGLAIATGAVVGTGGLGLVGLGGLAAAGWGGFNLLTNKPAAVASGSYQNAMSALAQNNPLMAEMLGDISAKSPMRVLANRALGGSGFAQRAQGIGVGLGMGEQQSYAMATQLSGMAGQTRGGAMLGGVAGLVKMGISQEIASTMTAGLAQTADTFNLPAQKAAENTRNYVNKIIARGLSVAGGTQADRVMVGRMGQFISQNLFSTAAGRVGGQAAVDYGRLMMNAMGPNPDMFGVASTQRVAGVMNNMFSGKAGGLSVGTGIAVAANALGPNASLGAIQFLSNMSMPGLMDIANGRNPFAKALGISPNAAKAVLGGGLAPQIRTLMANNPEFETILSAAGGNLGKAFKSMRNKGGGLTAAGMRTAAMMSLNVPGMQNPEDALRFMRTQEMLGMSGKEAREFQAREEAKDKKLLKSITGKDVGGGVDLTAAQEVARENVRLRGQENQNISTLIENLRNLNAAMETQLMLQQAVTSQASGSTGISPEEMGTIAQQAAEKKLTGAALEEFTMTRMAETIEQDEIKHKADLRANKRSEEDLKLRSGASYKF